MDTSIDTLVIEIESSAKEASGGIDSLIAKLENLKIKVNENLKAIGRLNSALIQLNANSKGVGNLGNIGKVSTPTATPNVPKIENVDTSSAVQGLKEMTGATTTTSNAISKLSSEYDTMGETGAKSVNMMGNDLERVSQKYDELGSTSNRTGSKLQNAFNKGGNAIQKFNNILSSLKSTFTTISLIVLSSVI